MAVGQTALRGRDSECTALDRVLDDARGGVSRALVLRGEPGVGKTTLLDRTAGLAPDFRVLRAVGVESEMELAFASLQQLCAAILDRLERLPEPQQVALGVAFGLRTGDAPDRFLVALATLSLLSEVAEERPLLCVVDDAQWLDDASAQALAFVARRLLAEPAAMVFVTREPTPALSGLPELVIDGVGEAAARELLAAAVTGPLDERVQETIIAETRGNPLALLELPRAMTPAELAGGFALATAEPLADRIQEGFVRRVESLPPGSQQLLLTAAAEPLGDVALLWRAAEQLGLGADTVGPAEAAGLVDIAARVRFRHPLVRSAIYRSAAPSDRRAVHRALAEATDPALDPDRRAWHHAHAAAGLDETVADELERSADRARARGGVAAAAAFLQRATELTPDPTRRGARALAAAQAKLEAGSRDAAEELLTAAELTPLDDLQRALLHRLRAQIAFVFVRGSDGPSLLLEAARELDAVAPAVAHETYLEALGAAMYSGRVGADAGVLEVAKAARGASEEPQPPRGIDLVLDGLARRCTEGPELAVPRLRMGLRAVMDDRLDGHGEVMRWLLLSPIVQSMTVFELWDDDAFHKLSTRTVRLARDTGALALLPVALVYQAGARVLSGELAAASALIQEADAISAATGNSTLVYGGIVLQAWRGVEAGAMELINVGLEDSTARSEGAVVALASYAAALLNNGSGRYEAAMEAASRGSDDGEFGYSGASLPELVEAATRSARPEIAASALSRLETRARAAGTDWSLGILARAHALVSEGEDADALYRQAIDHLDRTRVRIELARAHLLYGEWLRREKRRIEARNQLRTAHEMFSEIGAEAFTERARRELGATGETARRRTDETRGVLTSQEAQIAQLAQEGFSNPEIGAQLFISPRTVQYHLHKVFAKLEITSRNQLGRVPASRLSAA